MLTFTKATANQYLDLIRWESNDISACVGQEIANPILATSLYKMWCIHDMLMTPSEYVVRKGSEPFVEKIRENLSHLFEKYQTRLKSVGIDDMPTHMLNHIKYPYRYSIHENQTDTALFYNEVPQALNNSLMYGLSADGKYYDVALMYNDGSFRKYNSTQEVAIVKNDEVHVGGVVVIEFFGGSNSIDIPLKSLRAIRLTEIPAHIAAWLTVELV